MRLLLGLRGLLCPFCRMLLLRLNRHMMADRAARNSADDGMMMGHMTCDGPDGRTFQAAGFRRSGRSQHRGDTQTKDF